MNAAFWITARQIAARGKEGRVILKLPPWCSAIRKVDAMFDCLMPARDPCLTAVRAFYSECGHELADAARLLGGESARARVVSCALRLDMASRVDSTILRDLVALHRLLTLHDVGDPDRLETELFAALSPGSRRVETICLLADSLDDLLHRIQKKPSRESDALEPEDQIAA